MNVHSKKPWIVFVALIMLTLTFGCGSWVNLTGYADAMAERIYTGSSESLALYEKKAVIDISEQQNAIINDISLHLLRYIGIDQPDRDSQSSMSQWVQKALGYVRTEPCIPGDDGSMTLVIHPVDMPLLFGERLHDYYISFTTKNDQYYYCDLSDARFQNTYLKGVIKILNKALLSSDNKSTVRLTLDLTTGEDGRFRLEDDSIETMLTDAFSGYEDILDEPWPEVVRRDYDGFGDYVQGLMDCMYLCDPSLYCEVTDVSMDDAYEMYWNGLSSEVNVFLDYLGVDEVSEYLEDEIAYMLSYVYDYSDYYVSEGTNGNVNVTIYPINIYLDTYDDVLAFVDEFKIRNNNYEFADYTDEEYTEAFILPILDIFYDAMDDITYDDSVTITVHVDADSDGTLSLSDDDFSYIDYYIINYELYELGDDAFPSEYSSDAPDSDASDGENESSETNDNGTKSFDSFFNKTQETVNFGDDFI